MRNKLYLSLLIALHCNNIIAQNRYADIRVEFTSPDPGTIIQSPLILSFSFKVINQGPDTIFESDTLIYRPGHNFQEPLVKRKNAIGVVVPPGESFIISDTVTVDDNRDMDSFTLNFGYTPQTYGPDLGHGVLMNEFWEDRKDNMAVLYLKHKKNSVGMLAFRTVPLTIYPNPNLNGIFTIQGQLEFSPNKIELYDAFGIDIPFRTQVLSNGEIEVDASMVSIRGCAVLRITGSTFIITKNILFLE